MNTRNVSILSATALLPVALSLISTPVQAQSRDYSDRDSTPRVIVNDSRVDFSGQPPIARGGRVLVPLRGVLEKMGAYVDYDKDSQTVTAFQEGTRLSLPIGGREAKVNGENVSLDVPAQVINGSTMVPLRFVAESLGAQVNFNDNTNTVVINSSGTSNAGSSSLPPDIREQRRQERREARQQGTPLSRTFKGTFTTFTRQGNDMYLLRTVDGREIRVPGSIPIYYNDQKISVSDLRSGDVLTVTVDPDTRWGTRIVVGR